jgi:hypothetical protein
MIKVKVTDKKGKAEYPADHKPAMKVTKPGSSCSNCFFWDGKDCENKNYRQWNNGSGKIPVEDPETFCSDWWEPRRDK